MAAPEGPGTPGRRARDGSRIVTIEDVAREAQVAKSTVSRGLNNPGRLNSVTQHHIQQVAERLGYRPNPMARALGTRRTHTLALLVPDITNPFFFGLIRGAERQAAAAGHHLILSDSHGDPAQELRQIDRLTGSVDGFLLASARLPGAHLQRLAKAHRLVVLNRQIPGLSSVVVDPVTGPTDAVSHLASLGHRHIAYLGGPTAAWTNTRRWTAISAAGAMLGVSVARLGPYAAAQESGAGAADATIAEGASAAIAFDDLLAIGMLLRFAERGVRVPGDVSVVGFDDIFGASFCSPPLTTLAAPLEEVGRAAVQLLVDDRSPAAKPSQVVLATHLVVRDSTGEARRSAR